MNILEFFEGLARVADRISPAMDLNMNR